MLRTVLKPRKEGKLKRERERELEEKMSRPKMSRKGKKGGGGWKGAEGGEAEMSFSLAKVTGPAKNSN